MYSLRDTRQEAEINKALYYVGSSDGSGYSSCSGLWIIDGLQLVIRVPPGLHEDILASTLKHLTSIEMKLRNRLKLEPALILAPTKNRPPIAVLECQKQAQSSH
jgi:hypothetical protein